MSRDAEAREEVPQPHAELRPDGFGTAAWWRSTTIGTSALALTFGLLALVWLFARPLALLFAAIVVAEAMAPVVERLERWLPRTPAVILVYVGLGLVLGLGGWLLTPLLVDQAEELIAAGPEAARQVQTWLNRWDAAGDDRAVELVESYVARLGTTLVALPLNLVSSILDILLVLFMSAYWLILVPTVHRFVLSLVPASQHPRINSVLDEVSDTMGGYVRATAIDGTIVGVLVYAGLRVIGLDYPLVLALVAGVGELVPVFGPVVAAIPALAVAATESLTQVVVVALFYVVIQQIESNLLVPNIVHREAHVPPFLAAFAFLAGSAIGGILGALVAIPVVGALRVLALRVAAPAIRQWTGATSADLQGAKK